MSLITTIALPYLAGLVLAFVGPLVLGAILPMRWGQKITGVYVGLAMGLVGAALLVWKNPGWRLKKTVFDPEVNQYKISLKGRERHFADPLSHMSRLAGRAFGIVHADRNIVLTPREGDVGERYSELRSEDDWEFETDGGTYKRAYFHFDGGTRAVDIDGALSIIQGSAQPSSVKQTYKIVELAQKVWNTTNWVDYGIWISAMIFGFFLVLIGDRVSGGGGSSALESIELMVQVMPV